jgi:hypothetical protein
MLVCSSVPILKKYSDIKFNENPSSVICVFPCRWMDRHMLKLIVTFHSSANVPKNIQPLMGAGLLDPCRGYG